MPTSTANLVHDNSSLVNFQAWSNFIYQAFLTTAGWTQTADTGQTAPNSAASVGNYYFVFKASDALQASCPVFVRIDYGQSGTIVLFKVTVGQGSDGAGNPTGAVVGPYTSSNLTSNNGVSTYPCFASGDSGSIRILMWQGTNMSVAFGIERSKNASGVSTAGYVTLIGGYANGSGLMWTFQQLLAGNPNPTPNYTAALQGWVTLANPNVSLNFNGTTAAVPFIPLVGYPDNPMLDWCCVAFQDVTEGAIVTVSAYGANHTYVATKQSSMSRPNAGNPSSVAVLMRYE